MATLNFQGKTFDIPDEVAAAMERTINNAKKEAIERATASALHGKMVFSALTSDNSDIGIRGEEGNQYGPIAIIHRAVVKEDRCPLWMPNFNVRLKDMMPLQAIYPWIDNLVAIDSKYPKL